MDEIGSNDVIQRKVVVWSSFELNWYHDLDVKPEYSWETGRRVYPELNAFFSGTILRLFGL